MPQWWLSFGDPQLNTLIAGALADSPDLHAVQARVAEADATMSRALRQFDPQGGIRADAGAKHVDALSGNINLPNLPIAVPIIQTGTTRALDASFDVSWEIDVFGRRRATAVVARSRLYSAQLQAAAARVSLVALIADDLFAARGVAAELVRARENSETEHQALGLLQRRVTRGLASDGERLVQDMKLRAASSRVDAVSTQLDIMRRQLLVLVGRGTAPLSDLVIEPVQDEAPTVPRTAPGDLLKRRPDVMAAHSAVTAALGKRTLAKLDLFPSFSLSPGAGIEKQARPANVFTTGFWSLGAGLLMPILDRGRLLAELHANDARVTQAIADYEKAVQVAYGEADTVLMQLVADRRQLASLAEAARQARGYYDMTRKGEAAGVFDPDAALAARRQWQSTEIDLVHQRALVLRRSVQAFKALGGGWDDASVCARGRGCSA